MPAPEIDSSPESCPPPDFPCEKPLGSVSGVAPKLLVRKVGNKYVAGPTEDEVHQRYLCCFDLVSQLVAYCHRKLSENSSMGIEELHAKVALALRAKVEWGFSEQEEEWMMTHLCLRMGWPTGDTN